MGKALTFAIAAHFPSPKLSTPAASAATSSAPHFAAFFRTPLLNPSFLRYSLWRLLMPGERGTVGAAVDDRFRGTTVTVPPGVLPPVPPPTEGVRANPRRVAKALPQEVLLSVVAAGDAPVPPAAATFPPPPAAPP